MSIKKSSAVDIVAENTGEIRVYIAQFHSARAGRVIREYADAVNPIDLQAMTSADRAKVQYFALVNLGKETLPNPTCPKSACSNCNHHCHPD